MFGEASKNDFHINKSDRQPNTEMNKYKTKEIICYKCGKAGHIANECNIKLNKRRTTQWTHKKSKADGAFLLSMNNVDLDDSWLLDSGCTHHVSNRRD